MEPVLRDMNHHIYVLTVLLFLCQDPYDLFFQKYIWITELYKTQSELILLNFKALSDLFVAFENKTYLSHNFSKVLIFLHLGHKVKYQLILLGNGNIVWYLPSLEIT